MLRHAPEQVGLRLDEAGWVPVDDLLAALAAAGLPLTEAELAEVVARNDKQRFALVDGRIRAQQGHSVAVDLGLPTRRPPELLWHGTVERSVEAVLREGLRAGTRRHVHLSADVATARQVGARRGRPVVLEVAAAAAADGGVRFRLAGNGVWLADPVPPRYLRRT